MTRSAATPIGLCENFPPLEAGEESSVLCAAYTNGTRWLALDQPLTRLFRKMLMNSSFKCPALCRIPSLWCVGRVLAEQSLGMREQESRLGTNWAQLTWFLNAAHGNYHWRGRDDGAGTCRR